MSMIANNGKKVCFILSNGNIITKIIKDEKTIWELEGDILLKFAVDVAKGTTLFMIDSSTEVIAEEDYKEGDYLYFSKGTFQPTRVRFVISTTCRYDYYSEIRLLKGFDVSNITNMSQMFGGYFGSYSSNSILKLIDVSNLDTRKVTNMSYMISYCLNLTSVDVSNFDTSNVKGMDGMFCLLKLPKLNVSNFDTSKVTSFVNTFYGLTVTELDVSKFNTSNVTNMQYMFYNCSKLTSLDTSNFDTSKVTSFVKMFTACNRLSNLLFGPKWGTQTSTSTYALTLDLSNLNSVNSYKLTDETYNSMLTMYDRASTGLTTMTIKFSTKHNLPDEFAEKMSALGYTITLV